MIVSAARAVAARLEDEALLLMAAGVPRAYLDAPRLFEGALSGDFDVIHIELRARPFSESLGDLIFKLRHA